MRLFRPFSPWLIFVGPPADGGGTDTLTDEQFLEQKGFPRNTSTDDMEDAQKAAYWRDKSKSFQKDAEAKTRSLAQWEGLGAFDAVQTTISTAEQARQQSLTDAQRADEARQTAEASARTAGASDERSKLLPAAIESRVIAITRGASESFEDAEKRVKAAMQFVDVARFVTAEGVIDPALVQSYAASIAPIAGTGTGHQLDPLAGLMGRQVAPPPGSGGSIAEARRATRERLSPAPKK